MKLRAIRVENVRGFIGTGKAIEDIADGLNVLAAENEFGKTTLFDALRAVIFYKHTSSQTAVESLRPYQAIGAPTIEVDIELADSTYRLHKRFLSKRSASVMDLKTGQHIATGNSVNDWVRVILGSDKPDSGPTGLLWVEQSKSLETPIATGSSGEMLRGLLQTAVSDVTGGSNLHGVLARAKGELSKLITDKTKQPTGRYRDALNARDHCRQRVEDLERRLQDLEDKRSQLTALQAEIANLRDSDQFANRREDMKALTRQIMKVQQAAERYKGLENEVRLGEAAVTATKKELDDVRLRLANASHNEKQITSLRRDFETLEKKKDAQQKELIAARQVVEQNVKRLEDAKASLQQAQAAERAKSNRQYLKTLDQQIETVKAHKERLAAAQKTIARIEVDSRRMHDFEAQQRALDRAQANLLATSVDIRVAYNRGSKNKVRVEGQPLGDQDRLKVVGRVALDLDAIGQLIVESGSADDATALQEAVKQAEDTLKTSLNAANLNSIEAARHALAQKVEAERVLEVAHAEIQRAAPNGFKALQTQRQEFANLADDGLPDSDINEVAAKDLVKKAEESLLRAQEYSQTLGQEVASLDRKLGETQIRLQGLDVQLAEDKRVLGDGQACKERIQVLEEKVSQDVHALENAITARDLLQKDHAAPDTLRSLLAKQELLEQKHSAIEAKVAELTQKKDVLIGQLAELDREGVGETLSESRDVLERLNNNVDRFAEERRALELLIDSLETAEAHAQQQFFEPVMHELRPLMNHVLPEADIVLNRDFAPHEVVRSGLTEPYRGLSGGTREQISILIRLAFARFMASKGRGLPVILDDALVYSDDARIESMFQALAHAANDIQLIVLSCRQKTFAGLGGAVLRLQDWQSP